MNVELHSETPDLPIVPRLTELVKDATRVDIAVAFVTAFGADAIQAIVHQMKGQPDVHLLVSVLFPTDLHAIARLSEKIDVQVHRGRAEIDEKLHYQFHSKLILVERKGQPRTIVVGSHNWTANGLDGGNLEASLIVDCVESDLVVGQTRGHIEACRRVSEPFSPINMPVYEAIQREYHPHVGSTTLTNFPGFERYQGIVILSENHAQKLSNSGRLFFHIPVQGVDFFRFGTHVSMFVFPKDCLFSNHFPLPNPLEFTGKVETNDADRGRPSEVGDNGYLIRDPNRPGVEEVSTLPPLPEGSLLISVPFTRAARPAPLPLFHATNSLKPQWTFDMLPECEVYATTDMLRYSENRGVADRPTRSVPTKMAAETTLKVPFRHFAYPPTLKQLLEAFGLRQDTGAKSIPCRVLFDNPRMISEYISSVRFRSVPVLTDAIHGVSDQSTGQPPLQ
ncbi:MAG: phospholipase D-like domain-containing protein [Gemmataceae bacterium]